MNRIKSILSVLLAFVGVCSSLRAADSSAAQEIRNRWPVGATLIYLAESGTVRKGAVVAVLDPAALVNEVRRLEGLLGGAQTEQKSLQEQRAKAGEADASPQKLVKESEEAQKLYADYDAMIGELSLQQALNDASLAYDQERVRFNARDKLLNEGFIQKTEYDLQGGKLQSAKIAADLARAKLNRFLNGERPQKEAELAQKVEEAKSALKKAEAKNAAAKEQTTGRLAELSKKINALQSAIGAAKEQLGTIVLAAPANGSFQPRSSEETSSPPVRVGSLIGPGELIGHFQAQ